MPFMNNDDDNDMPDFSDRIDSSCVMPRERFISFSSSVSSEDAKKAKESTPEGRALLDKLIDKKKAVVVYI